VVLIYPREVQNARLEVLRTPARLFLRATTHPSATRDAYRPTFDMTQQILRGLQGPHWVLTFTPSNYSANRALSFRSPPGDICDLPKTGSPVAPGAGTGPMLAEPRPLHGAVGLPTPRRTHSQAIGIVLRQRQSLRSSVTLQDLGRWDRAGRLTLAPPPRHGASATVTVWAKRRHPLPVAANPQTTDGRGIVN